MRITFVLPHAGMAGGIRVVAIYAERLRRRGHDVVVVSTPRNDPPLRRRVKWFVQGKGWHRLPGQEPSYFDGLGVTHRVIETYRPVTEADVPDADVVCATWWRTAEWVARMSPAKGAKAILLQGYEVIPGEQNPQIDAAWRQPLHKIVISAWLKDLARTRFGDEDVSHVPNAVDLGQFHAPERGKQATPTVGMLFNPLPIKGVDVAVRAWEACRGGGLPDVKLIAFGSERPDDRSPLPAGTEFIYRPPQDSIREIYSRCDVWLCGSRCEGFHLPPLEAMACRCPVVSTRVGGPMDMIRNGENGYLVDVLDWQALADRLSRVLTADARTWRAMSDTAFATATGYTWDDATDLLERALIKTYEKAGAGRAAARLTRATAGLAEGS